MSEELLVVPGDALGVLEEYVPAGGAYVIDGFVRASVLGLARRRADVHEVSVDRIKRVSMPGVGDSVYAIVDGLRESICYLQIYLNESRGHVYAPFFRGILHSFEVSSERLGSLREVFGYGDIVRARVLSSKPPFLLSTRGFDYGVVLAHCPRCMGFLRKKGLGLYCPRCRKNFRKRKVSRLYMLK